MSSHDLQFRLQHDAFANCGLHLLAVCPERWDKGSPSEQVQQHFTMTIKASCPSCAGHFSFDDTQVGQASSCPHCQSQITLTVPAPPTAPAASPVLVRPAPAVAAVPGVRKAFETRAEFLKRIRAESSYETARQLAAVIFGLLGGFGVLVIGGSALGVGAVGAGSFAIGLAAGSVIVVLALAGYQSAVVVFDISDALIEGRGT